MKQTISTEARQTVNHIIVISFVCWMILILEICVRCNMGYTVGTDVVTTVALVLSIIHITIAFIGVILLTVIYPED